MAWRSLDASFLENILSPSFPYGSFWVMEDMNGTAAYLDYLGKKFTTIQGSGSAPTLSIVRLTGGATLVGYRYALLLNQGGRKSLLLFAFEGERIKNSI